MLFWILVGVLTLLGVATLVPAVLRAENAADDSDIHADQVRRLDELERDLADGEIGAQYADAVRDDIERALLEDLQRPAAAVARSGKRRIAAIAAVVIVVPACALLTYFHVGSPGVAEFALAHPEMALGTPETSMELMLREIHERLAEDPNDTRALAILIRMHMTMRRYAEAAGVAGRLYRLQPHDARVALQYVDALAMSAGGRIAGRTAQLTDGVLQRDPANVSAMILKGIAHQQADQPDAAIGIWHRALALLPEDAPLRGDVTSMIEQAGAAASPLLTAPASTSQVALKVDVSLDQALRTRVAPGDTVFIAARALSGPKVPLAVSRHTVAELPLSVVLDESLAMVPGMSLAQFPDVQIVARVSKSGTALPQSGDLQGRSAPINSAETGAVQIVIDDIVE